MTEAVMTIVANEIELEPLAPLQPDGKPLLGSALPFLGSVKVCVSVRVGSGSVSVAELLELKQGDQVIVETRDRIYTYVMDDSPANLTVHDTETWVLDPDPRHLREPRDVSVSDRQQLARLDGATAVVLVALPR